MNVDTIMWLIAAVVLLVVEGVTINLVSVWFAIGALCAAAAAYFFGAGLLVQWIVFVAVSLILVACTRKFARKVASQKSATNFDRVIGEVGIVLKTIDPIENKGEVKVIGQIWSARSKNGSTIEEGTRVRILSVEGVRVIVEEENN